MPRHQGRGNTGRESHLYRQVVAEAARLLAEGAAVSFDAARRKAQQRIGCGPLRQPPSNAEIEQALIEYQRLFQSDTQPAALQRLRQTALRAMRLLVQFDPRLVGPVLSGSADDNSIIYLHLFADFPEAVAMFLMDQHVPFEHDERRVRFGPDEITLLPLYRFVAGDTVIELTIFPAHGLRRPPLSPVDNRPMRRGDTATVEQLLAPKEA